MTTLQRQYDAAMRTQAESNTELRTMELRLQSAVRDTADALNLVIDSLYLFISKKIPSSMRSSAAVSRSTDDSLASEDRLQAASLQAASARIAAVCAKRIRIAEHRARRASIEGAAGGDKINGTVEKRDKITGGLN